MIVSIKMIKPVRILHFASNTLEMIDIIGKDLDSGKLPIGINHQKLLMHWTTQYHEINYFTVELKEQI